MEFFVGNLTSKSQNVLTAVNICRLSDIIPQHKKIRSIMSYVFSPTLTLNLDGKRHRRRIRLKLHQACKVLWDGIIFSFCKRWSSDPKVAVEHLSLSFKEIRKALIMVPTWIFLGHYTQLGTFLSRKDNSTAAHVWKPAKKGQSWGRSLPLESLGSWQKLIWNESPPCASKSYSSRGLESKIENNWPINDVVAKIKDNKWRGSGSRLHHPPSCTL